MTYKISYVLIQLFSFCKYPELICIHNRAIHTDIMEEKIFHIMRELLHLIRREAAKILN